MIDYEKFCKIKMLQQCKFSARQISDACNINEKTARKYLNLEHFAPRKATPRSSKLDSFKKQIVAMLERYEYTTMQVFQQLKQDGYTPWV